MWTAILFPLMLDVHLIASHAKVGTVRKTPTLAGCGHELHRLAIGENYQHLERYQSAWLG